MLIWVVAGLALMVGLLASHTILLSAAPAGQGGTQGEAIFQSKCASCHTIGQGKLVGPDLKDVTARRDAAWLRSFISNPDSMFAANDPTAQQLLQQFNGVKMPALGLSNAEVDAVIAYLAGPGPAAPVAPVATAPAGDPAAGRLFFTGEMALSGSGPACIACHNVRGVGILGGGALGPDLTRVVQRLGEPGLAAALANIAFPTMVGPFANRPLTAWEQASLVAFLKQADQAQIAATGQSAPAQASPGAITIDTAWLLGIGLAGAIALTVVLFVFWRRQRQSISARLREAGRVK